ncbi:MAG: hypothetical protein KatS3mg112_0071 [Thermogutta sp.]|nr:MAG: hypothetical protein KatS3mg112_0071 [Thermogutta sp.]
MGLDPAGLVVSFSLAFAQTYPMSRPHPEGPYLEGPACQVRRATFDHRFPIPGHDKRAPPIFGKPFAPKHPSEGPACQVRLPTLDVPSQFTRAPVGAIHELPLPRWCRRDPPVGSDEDRLMIHPASSGTTSVPLRKNSGGTACRSACQPWMFHPNFTQRSGRGNS